jgi:hypothetical protein
MESSRDSANRWVNNQGYGTLFDCSKFSYGKASDMLRRVRAAARWGSIMCIARDG